MILSHTCLPNSTTSAYNKEYFLVINMASELFDKLLSLYPNYKTELIYHNPYELLVAVILSAQCTDERVNKVTPSLFKKYPTVFLMAEANQKELEKLIFSCGFYKNKAKSIISACKDIVEKFEGIVPDTTEKLTTLKGVGKKTANVILAQAFNKPAIAVDTHVKRVAFKLGLTKNDDPQKIEEDLQKIIPKDKWIAISGIMVLHGRYVCKSRKPLCEKCEINKFCSYYKSRGKKLPTAL